MSGFRFSNNLSLLSLGPGRDSHRTSKQYFAVADDFLRKLFPELTPHRLPCPGYLTVFITDDVVH